MDEHKAELILLAALGEHRCAELLECLFDGGSAMVVKGHLTLVTAAQLREMVEQ